MGKPRMSAIKAILGRASLPDIRMDLAGREPMMKGSTRDAQ